MSSLDESSEKGSERSSSPSDRKKRKRGQTSSDYEDDSSDSEASSNDRPFSKEDAPRIVSGIVDFKLSPVVHHFTCPLCSGLFREPVTIDECLHTFCKSCLFQRFNAGLTQCPTCKCVLGQNPWKHATPDRALQHLGDKVLFPRVREEDDSVEKEFYSAQGIEMKREFDNNVETDDTSTEPSSAVVKANDELEFTLVPDVHADTQHELPKLERSCIRTSGRLKIGQLKKYLLKQLGMPSTNVSLLEVMCNGSAVGNELTLAFIVRTIWLHTNHNMRLTYRKSEEYVQDFAVLNRR